jgi:hypothetical protein
MPLWRQILSNSMAAPRELQSTWGGLETRAWTASSAKMPSASIASMSRQSATGRSSPSGGPRSRRLWEPFKALKPAVASSFITTSRFTADATSYVERVPARVVLIDGRMLADLMVKHNIGVQDQETYVIKRIDEDFFEDTT